jgi:hypothetical protein
MLRHFLAAVLPALIFACTTAPGADEAHAREYQTKAAFVLNFARLLEWPASRFMSDEQPIAIAVVGHTPLSMELQSIVKDRRVHGRPILVKSAETVDDVRDVQVLFVGAGESAAFATIWTAAQSGGVLTVGESPEFEAAGGIITFLIEGDKVRFAINMGSAEQAHLKISAQLQQLAASVRRTP